MPRRRSLFVSILSAAVLVSVAACPKTGTDTGPTPPGDGDANATPGAGAELRHPDETHLADIVQLTDGGENAEAYWSFDGTELIFQTTREPYACDQIMTMPADGAAPATLVSTGKGRTTCAYFLPGDEEIVYSSTHHRGEACPEPPDHSKGYVWGLFDYDVFRAKADGSGLEQLTDRDGYDAEATVCPVDGTIIFTSDRDGDLDLYKMEADGSNVVRLTDTPGYDGGAFFSQDCTQIVWRASRPTGEELDDFKSLLAEGLVRPGKLEIFVADADGKNARQITYLGAAAFAPYFHPSGERVLFSTNYPNPRGREFDIWAVDTDGTRLERITYSEGFDGFPMFSPDGTKLAFSSNRNQSKPGETNVFVASWVDHEPEKIEASPADEVAEHVAWLADDERDGRGVGTPGLVEAGAYLSKRLASYGVDPAFGDSFAQPVEVTVGLEAGEETALTVRGEAIATEHVVPASVSAPAEVTGRTVPVGYGIVADDLGVNDYARRRVKGRIAVARRFVPEGDAFSSDDAKRRYSDIAYKAFVAREHGATGLIIVDEEAELPALVPVSNADAGIPVMVANGAQAARLVRGSHRVRMRVALERRRSTSSNIVGKISAGAEDTLPGAVVVGAHYDHLGMGGPGSLEPGKEVVHNGADDNASGTAALLLVAKQLANNKADLRRDVYIAFFTAEEMGLVGSGKLVRELPGELEADHIVAMLNMDMVGRMRNNRLSALGSDSAAEWNELVEAACAKARVRCAMGGDGYGPSDQMSFYAAGVPVLHLFTGAHADYHKSTDDAGSVNAVGAARVAAIVADLAAAVAAREAELTYQKVAAPPPAGDVRATGGSLGTIPDYSNPDDDTPGVLLTDVREGGPADQAGLRGGDRIVAVGGKEVRNLRDLMYVLRQAHPGEKAKLTFVRDGAKKTTEVTFGKPRRRN